MKAPSSIQASGAGTHAGVGPAKADAAVPGLVGGGRRAAAASTRDDAQAGRIEAAGWLFADVADRASSIRRGLVEIVELMNDDVEGAAELACLVREAVAALGAVAGNAAQTCGVPVMRIGFEDWLSPKACESMATLRGEA